MGKEKRPFFCHQNFVPNGLSAPARGYIQIGKVIRAFCWHQKFVPKGLSALVPGLYTYRSAQEKSSFYGGMRAVASSSISHEKTQSTQVCCFPNCEYFTFTFSGPSGLCGSTLKWKQSVARSRARRVRDVACSISLTDSICFQNSDALFVKDHLFSLFCT